MATAITQYSTLEDICFAVCTALQNAGTTAVLTGGSAATYYAPQRYQSFDADFIITMRQDGRSTADALASLGFTERGGAYEHPATQYTIEFPPGPIAIGDVIITDWETMIRGDETLHVLSRTDSVRDRLAAFYHWSDRSSLITALAVAESGEIDLSRIEAWSNAEGAAAKFREFADRLEGIS
jgi:hypothetical protein